MADLKNSLAYAPRRKSLSDLDLTDDERLKMLLEDAGKPSPSPTPTPSPIKGGMPTDEDEMIARLLKLNRSPASDSDYPYLTREQLNNMTPEQIKDRGQWDRSERYDLMTPTPSDEQQEVHSDFIKKLQTIRDRENAALRSKMQASPSPSPSVSPSASPMPLTNMMDLLNRSPASDLYDIKKRPTNFKDRMLREQEIPESKIKKLLKASPSPKKDEEDKESEK